MVLFDNSADQINGDYFPTRWESQVEVAGVLFTAKSQGNIDNAVGVATMANSVEVLCTPTTDSSKVSASLYNIKLSGQIRFVQVQSHSNLGPQDMLFGSQEQAESQNSTKNIRLRWLSYFIVH